MIYDLKQNLLQYKGISKNLDTAIEYLLKTDFSSMEEGKYSVDGDRVFALVQTPVTRSKEKCRWEAHGKYIDIQYMLEGSEIIGFQNTSELAASEPYRAENDIAFFADNGKGFFPHLVPDSYVVCFPWDAHMPLIYPDNPQKIKKVVIKVKAD